MSYRSPDLDNSPSSDPPLALKPVSTRSVGALPRRGAWKWSVSPPFSFFHASSDGRALQQPVSHARQGHIPRHLRPLLLHSLPRKKLERDQNQDLSLRFYPKLALHTHPGPRNREQSRRQGRGMLPEPISQPAFLPLRPRQTPIPPGRKLANWQELLLLFRPNRGRTSSFVARNTPEMR